MNCSRLLQFQQKNYSRVIVKAATAIVLAVCLAAAAARVSADDEKPPNKPARNSETNTPSFKQPHTLTELLALPSDQLEKVDTALINLLCAEGLRGSENLDVAYFNPRTLVVIMEGDEGNPLVTGAPGITYSVAVTFDRCTHKMEWEGSHDKFPSHDFYEQGKQVHHFSHTAAGTSPWYLFPPAPNQKFKGKDIF